MNFKKISTLGLIGVSALLLSACSLYGTNRGNSGNSAPQSSSGGQAQEAAAITFGDSGVTSQTTVTSGGKIKWVNNSSKKVSVASDPHPVHSANSEITNGQFVIELAPGASAEVTVTKKGTWGFHDHLNPTTKGTVVVQ